jgi:hypothetical protein
MYVLVHYIEMLRDFIHPPAVPVVLLLPHRVGWLAVVSGVCRDAFG